MVSERTTVQICGMTFQMESDLPPLEVQSIAKYVEEKINEVNSSPNTQQTTSKIAILACLNIACELFRFRNNNENISRIYNSKADEMIQRIDSAIK